MTKHLRKVAAFLLAAQMLVSVPAGTAFGAAKSAPSRTYSIEELEGWESRVTDDAIEVNALAFGADPSGRTDSAAAVEKALAYAKEEQEKNQGKPVRLVFAKGEYGFWSDYAPVRELYVSNTVGINQTYKNKHIGILVEDMHDVTVDGGGSLFLYHGDVTAFASIRSENVTFTNFDFDFASPTVVDVTVESSEGNSAVVYIPECYNYTIDGTSILWEGEKSPVTGSPYWSGRNGLQYSQIYDYAGGRTWRGGSLFSNVSKMEDIGDNRVRITYNSAGNVPTVGYCYQLRNTTRTTPGTFFWESTNVTVQDINVHFLHGFGMVGQLSDTITLDNVDFVPRPGSGRATVGFADFIQMSSVKGKVTVKDCTFTNPHDDPINIHGTYLTVSEVSDDHKTFTLQYRHNETGGFPQYYVGDEVEFVTKGTMIPVENGTARVVSVDGPNQGNLNTITITLDRAVEGITGGNNNFAVENVTYTPEVEITGNRFLETPTRGILVTTRKPVLIKDNYFDGMGMASIFISCDAQGWYESGPVRDVTITGNVFDRPQSNAILIEPTNPTNDPDYQIHQNIKITDNVFNLSGPNAINAKSVNGLTIEGNTFNRYDPDVRLSLSADSQTLEAGKSLATKLDKSGNTYGAQMYQLRACRNVTIANNTYDAGFNLRANTAEGTSESDVTITDSGVLLNQDNREAGYGPITYVSSDESVATVDSDGTVHAMGSGTADIWAYSTCGSRIFASNRLTLTVTGDGSTEKAPASIVVDGPSVINPGETAAFTAKIAPDDAAQSVVWSVRDAATGESASFASIDESGLLSASSYGVAEITAASSANGSILGKKLVTVSKPSGSGLNGKWTIQQEDSSRWTLDPAAKSVTITGQNGGMWDGNASAHNVFVTDAPSGDFSATVKLSGKTSGNGSDWEEAGLIIMKDQNNYIAAVRKNNAGAPKLAVNNETNARPKESVMDDVAGTDVFLKIEKTGTNFACSYSTDGSSWTPITQTGDTSSNSALDGSGLKVGFYAGNKDNGRDYTFSGFAIDGAEVSLVDSNTAPAASELTISGTAAAGETLRVDYAFTDAENDAEGASIYRWSAADAEEGPYQAIEGATGQSYAVPSAYASKFLRAEVVPVDAYGSAGAPVASGPVQVAAREAQPSNAELEAVSMSSGLSLNKPFQTSETAYTLFAPSSLEKAEIRFSAVESEATLSLTADGKEAAAGVGTLSYKLAEDDSLLSLTVTSPNGEAARTYTLQVNRLKNSNAKLASLTAEGVSLPDFSADRTSYLTTAGMEQRSMRLQLAAQEESALLSVQVNNKTISDFEGNTFDREIPLAAGSNAVAVTVRAEDGSTKLYRIVVFRTGSSNANAAQISAVEHFDPDVTEYVVNVPEENGGILPLKVVPEDENASVSITANGEYIPGGEADVALEDGLNTITVKITPETLEKPKYYVLTVRQQSASDAGLSSLQLDGVKTSPAFATDVTAYAASVSGEHVTLRAAAFEPEAQITVLCNGQRYQAAGSIAQELSLYEGGNPVYVTVASPDGSKTRTYTVGVDASGAAYLSDLEWQSATCGYTGVIQKDKSFDGNKITLLGEDGPVSYEKGLGIHANSVIVYDVAGKGYTGFHAFAGIDQEITKPTEPDVNFIVLVNGEEKFRLSNANGYTKQAEISIPLDETAETVTLKAEFDSHDWSAHGSWADAKFTSPLPQAPVTDVQVESVKALPEKELALHTALSDADLPETVEVSLTDGTAVSLPVEWVGNYDTNEAGSFVLRGILLPTEGLSNPDGIFAELSVSVKEVAQERTLTVNFPARNVQLSVKDGDVGLANLTGKYEAAVLSGSDLSLTFTPTVEGRELAAVQLNGAALPLEKADSYTYTAQMPGTDTALDFTFTVVDKQILRTVITAAEGLYKGDEYNAAVPSVRAKFDGALALAQAVEGKLDATQKEIDKAWSDMLDAIHLLSFAEGDKTILDELFELAEKLHEEDFTASTWAVYEGALEEAQEIYSSKEVLDAEVKEAAKKLKEAMEGLAYRADLSALESLIAKAEKIVPMLKEHYLEDGQAEFLASLDAARNLDAASVGQEEADLAAEALLNAMSALRRIPNKDALEDLLAETKQLHLSDYTVSSANKLRSAQNAALSVLQNAQATEAEVEEAYHTLRAAKDALERKAATPIRKKGANAAVRSGNIYGAAGRVLVGSAKAEVRSNVTGALTLQRGQSAVFQMTVVNGNGQAPNFTAGNGSVLKTQTVSQSGNVYTYRVWAVGAPGSSTGVYTRLPNGELQRHCVVTIA